MKKILLFTFFISLSSYSQLHVLTHTDEKISYAEYDYLKYIASIDNTFFAFDKVTRYYDNGTTLLYSVLENKKDDKVCKITFLPTGTIEYITTGKLKDKVFTNTGTLKINGVNNFFSFSSCNSDLCEYKMYVNKDVVYKGSSTVK